MINNIQLKIRFLLVFIIILLVLGTVYNLIDAIYINQVTGTLIANSPGNFLTIEQGKDKLVNLGWSTAKVKLRPGSYLLLASSGHSQTSSSFSIVAKKTTVKSISIKKTLSPGYLISSVDGNKLIASLPFIGPNFNYEINYKYQIMQKANLPIIVITAPNTTYRNDALNVIEALGFNPSVLNIQYVVATPSP